MKLDFYHNKIVADTISAEFEQSFRSILIPLLEEKYGIIPEIQMYEDYIADNLLLDGFWYYPLTLVTAGGEITQWVRWPMQKNDFEDGIPYSYIGSGRLNFELVEELVAFKKKIEGRAIYSSGGCVKVRIEALGGDPTKLSGKYSQTFIDEMARQITVAIESATGVEGLADSSVELVMVFAPGTYMEHTSENRTYRRLMLIDKVSAPRDFWIQWTRLDGAVAHSVSSHVSAENILFELGEDVEQKIREREYRYLLTSGKEKYHSSMGRKKVTEWREVIKRAAKRGELLKIETDFELAPETVELEERIADLLGKRSADRVGYEKAEIPYITEENDDFARAMEKARMIVEQASTTVDEPISFTDLAEALSSETESDYTEDAEILPEAEVVTEGDEEDILEGADNTEDEDELDIFDEIKFDHTEDEEIEENDEFDQLFEDTAEPEEDRVETVEISEEDNRVVDIFKMIDYVLTEDIPDEDSAPAAEENSDPVEEEYIASGVIDEVDVVEEVAEEASLPDVEILEEPEAITEIVSLPVTREQASITEEIVEAPHAIYDTPLADRAADIRAEIETKIRLEYESRARMKAEQEIVALRREQEKLKIEKEALEAEAKKEQERLLREYEMLRIQTKRAEEERAVREAQRRAEEIRLREQIEAQLRQEAMERERLAEAARMAIEEQHRLEAENARMARIREEEERREAEKLRREQEERELEALRQAEIERIRREDEEAKARARAAMPEMGDGRYSYTSKSVKFLFRKSVDPNITNRIYEIMKATVEYYGKDRVYLKIKATVPDSQTVVLDFEHIPIEEMELLGNIIKILGNSGLGIAKAIIE